MASSARILVTGSSGQLGREIVLLLRAQGYAPYGVDLVPAPTTNSLLDVRDAAAVLDAMRGAQAVVHTAALHGKHYELAVPRLEFIRTNVEGTLNLLNACVQHGIKKLLYTSTTS
ncbi:MAG TPA: NAD(P)-dependent oxidoreductase, partial [Hymenobacter sp.]